MITRSTLEESVRLYPHTSFLFPRIVQMIQITAPHLIRTSRNSNYLPQKTGWCGAGFSLVCPFYCFLDLFNYRNRNARAVAFTSGNHSPSDARSVTRNVAAEETGTFEVASSTLSSVRVIRQREKESRVYFLFLSRPLRPPGKPEDK